MIIIILLFVFIKSNSSEVENINNNMIQEDERVDISNVESKMITLLPYVREEHGSSVSFPIFKSNLQI